MMKQIKFTLCLAALHLLVLACAAPREYRFTEASELNLIGKILEGTPNPYHRVDTCVFKGFTKDENRQVRCSAGLAVLFTTNSTVISVKGEYGYCNMGVNTMGIALRGYDLYIRKDGEWLFAGSKCPKDTAKEENLVLVEDMDDSVKECLLYLPMYSEMRSVKIGVEKGAFLRPLESPFRHRIGIFGSSFTQGVSISRSGMTYPMQFMRHTGLQLLSIACSGNCKLQPYFADVLNAADLEAVIIDGFSNPSPKQIEERLFPFIERLRSAHPDIPLIFMQTIYRQYRNFNQKKDHVEREKMEVAARLMQEAVRKYPNVYFLVPDTGPESKETSVDGIHPSDMGHLAWARSLEVAIRPILDKYGIR